MPSKQECPHYKLYDEQELNNKQDELKWYCARCNTKGKENIKNVFYCKEVMKWE